MNNDDDAINNESIATFRGRKESKKDAGNDSICDRKKGIKPWNRGVKRLFRELTGKSVEGDIYWYQWGDWRRAVCGRVKRPLT